MLFTGGDNRWHLSIDPRRGVMPEGWELGRRKKERNRGGREEEEKKMQKGTPNLQKLPTTAADKRHALQLQASKNHPTSQKPPPKASIFTPQQQLRASKNHPRSRQIPPKASISTPQQQLRASKNHPTSQHTPRNASIFTPQQQLRAYKNHLTSQQTPTKASTSTPQHYPSKKQKTSITETGQSSSSKLFCKICLEAKHPTEIFTIEGCGHQFCPQCIGQHAAAKIQENSPSVRCPEPSCKGVLEPVLLQPILAPDVFDRWGRVLCESLILESMKFYCPFKDCSGLLVDERGKDGVAILESECPHCRRLFCAKCKVPWHSGISCDDFQKLGKHERNREDIMLMNLAKNKKWQRCPQCGFYVERIEGCLFMKCRCKYCFCYHCGGPSDPKYHYCSKCGR